MGSLLRSLLVVGQTNHQDDKPLLQSNTDEEDFEEGNLLLHQSLMQQESFVGSLSQLDQFQEPSSWTSFKRGARILYAVFASASTVVMVRLWGEMVQGKTI